MPRSAPMIASVGCFVALIGGLFVYAAFVQPRVEVGHVELAVSDVERSRRFFEGVLMFKAVKTDSERHAVTLRLGDETLQLRQRAVAAPPSTLPANDIRFQHLALVVSDIDDASRRLIDNGVTLVSPKPQTLPAWNRDVAGIEALYFRDPDGHFLELIAFPRSKGEPRWHGRTDGLFLGIDHTALVVKKTAPSLAFYRDEIGLTEAGKSFNRGPEQAALGGVADARVRVTSLRGGAGMGVELLEYETPGAVGSAAADDADWQMVLESDERGAESVTRDPDGHALAVSVMTEPKDSHALAALRGHWQRYCMEAAELGVFMIVTLWLTLLLEHPRSPARKRLPSAFLRRVLMGAAIGGTVILIINSRWGSQSGAHFNPAVTLSYLRLGRINGWDALFYVLAQFVGGWLGLMLAAQPFRRAARHEKVAHAATVPKSGGVAGTLAAEFVISFVLLAVLLIVQQRPAVRSQIAYFAGALLLLYIMFESPVSGMSLNPARTVASALAERKLAGAWLYFVAPIAGMLAAAQCFAWSPFAD